MCAIAGLALASCAKQPNESTTYEFETDRYRSNLDYEDEIISCMKSEGFDMPYGMLGSATSSTATSDNVLAAELAFGIVNGATTDELAQMLSAAEPVGTPIDYAFLGNTPFEVFEATLYGSENKEGCLNTVSPPSENPQDGERFLAHANSIVQSVAALDDESFNDQKVQQVETCITQSGFPNIANAVLGVVESARSGGSEATSSADFDSSEPDTDTERSTQVDSEPLVPDSESTEDLAEQLQPIAEVIQTCDENRHLQTFLNNRYNELSTQYKS